MDYMEAVKKLEEKLVSNQQKYDHGSVVDVKCNGEVVSCRIISYVIFDYLKDDCYVKYLFLVDIFAYDTRYACCDLSRLLGAYSSS